MLGFGRNGNILSIYCSNQFFVKIVTDCSNAFATSKGVRQGCNLFPMLFHIYDKYAGDTVNITASVEDMQELLRSLKAESLELGLTINKIKSKLMIKDCAEELAKSCTIPSA